MVFFRSGKNHGFFFLTKKNIYRYMYIDKFMMFQIIDLFDLYLFATEIGYGLVLGRGLLLLTHSSKDKILGVGLARI